LTFFGLTQSYKVSLIEEIHDLVYHGNGGFNYESVYNMPILHRRIHIKRINDFILKQNEKTNSSPKEPKRFNIPDIAKKNSINLKNKP